MGSSLPADGMQPVLRKGFYGSRTAARKQFVWPAQSIARATAVALRRVIGVREDLFGEPHKLRFSHTGEAEIVDGLSQYLDDPRRRAEKRSLTSLSTQSHDRIDESRLHRWRDAGN